MIWALLHDPALVVIVTGSVATSLLVALARATSTAVYMCDWCHKRPARYTAQMSGGGKKEKVCRECTGI